MLQETMLIVIGLAELLMVVMLKLLAIALWGLLLEQASHHQTEQKSMPAQERPQVMYIQLKLLKTCSAESL